MAQKKICQDCGKSPLSKDEIGLTKKLLDMDAKRFFCISCLAAYLEVEEDFCGIKLKRSRTKGVRCFDVSLWALRL